MEQIKENYAFTSPAKHFPQVGMGREIRYLVLYTPSSIQMAFLVWSPVIHWRLPGGVSQSPQLEVIHFLL